ncbi:NAD(P)-dependent oxidoreductase [Dietzia sp. NCCP-2495]|uniref:SDR family oxidoreductase n=1 Tax=Dietzia sp. NCCP-2495 TaxID=2934675 RepID=UPI00222F8C89|nr:SDR family oxidoreductase [Dietzia sp. NCCP-2495]GLB63951.1 NAD(P)-dependent oxidoreductase [Dietzia sp. NCCP-2495]
MTYAVTGATGHLGGLIIDSLLSRGVAAGDITAVVRDEAKAAPLAAKGVTVAVAAYEDVRALTDALTGVERLVMVSGSEVGKRLAQHTNVIDAAKAAGVTFIAYTSLLHADTSQLGLAPEHLGTEKLLADSGIDHALLRNGWYWENYASALDSGKAAGKFFGAAGDAKVSGAARRDFAEAAAIVVTGENQAGKVYELAGSPALSYPEIAAEVGTVLGTEVAYVNQTTDEYASTLESFGLPGEVAAMVAGMDEAIATGAVYSESTDLQDLLGRPSTSVAAALAQ